MTQIEINQELDAHKLIERVHGMFDENASSVVELQNSLRLLQRVRDSLPERSRERNCLTTVCVIVSVLIRAVAARLKGKIGHARRHEAEADRLYLTLPEAWRW